MQLLAPAKINLFLRSAGRRDDGFHELDTVFVHTDFADRLTLETRHRTITVESPLGLDASEDLAGRAALALRAAAGDPELGVHIVVSKKIPVGGGLGGGSSNAAATLRGLHQLWGLSLGEQALLTIAAGLGADVPFLLRGGLKRGRGIGEKLQPIPCAVPTLEGLLLFPPVGVSTPAAFAWLDADGFDCDQRSAAPLLDALARGDAAAVIDRCYNGFTDPVRRRVPSVAEALDEARAAGFRPLLCGSGSTVLALRPPGVALDASELRRWNPISVCLTGLGEDL
jgi:4-diphosphocytidyl-2-C-methyl-D-erythritol kinase